MGRFSKIQGQMFYTQFKKVNFLVYFGKNVSFGNETVTLDEKFWQQNLSRIESFFRRAAVLEFFTRRVQRGEKLY